MRYAVIGTGYWGSNHARVAAELLAVGTVDEVVLCDRDESRVAQLAELYGVPYVTDTAELCGRVDAATIATPSPTHRAVATELLTNGVDVLVEKPLALSGADAWTIVDTARTHNRTLGTGHIFRYHPALRDLKRRVDRGSLGRIKYLDTARYSFRAPRATMSVLDALAVHDVDIYSYLLDERPERVYCALEESVRDGIADTATVTLSFGSATGVVRGSWHVPGKKRRELTVVGTERTATIDYLEDTRLEIHDGVMNAGEDGVRIRSDGSQVYHAEDEEPLRVEAEAFLEAARNGRSPPACGRVGARAVELLEAAKESAEAGRAVSVSEVSNPEH